MSDFCDRPHVQISGLRQRLRMEVLRHLPAAKFRTDAIRARGGQPYTLKVLLKGSRETSVADFVPPFIVFDGHPVVWVHRTTARGGT